MKHKIFSDLQNKKVLLMIFAFSFVFFPIFSVEKPGDINSTVVNRQKLSESDVSEKKSSPKKINFQKGIINLYSNSKLGSFVISAENSEGKKINLLSDILDGASNFFVLKAGNSVYRLGEYSKVKTSSKKEENGICITYEISKVAIVNVKMEFVSSLNEFGKNLSNQEILELNDADMVKISVEVQNTGRKTSKMALKAVLDTILGESNRYHFYTYDNKPVLTEQIYRKFDENPYFVSKNSLASMQFIFYGGDITEPESVSLAGFSTLDSTKWEPYVNQSRTFDSLLSYNNSGIAITWPGVKTEVNKSFKVVFYVAAAVDSEDLKGDLYFPEYKNNFEQNKTENQNESKTLIEIPSEPKTEIPEENKNSINEKSDEPVVSFVVQPEQKNNQPVLEETQDVDVKEGKTDISDSPDVKFEVKKITPEQLSYDYIQELINKITALENSDDSISREEILAYNEELDAILESLSQ